MNKEESLALLAQGREAWNAWAHKIQAECKALELAGAGTVVPLPSEWNDATRDWHTAAAADFSGHHFADNADLSGFVFPGDAVFERASFSGSAQFDDASFSAAAQFKRATFSAAAQFEGASFTGRAQFGEATFSGNAWFGDATFSGNAEFGDATFSGNAQFGGASFSRTGHFDRATFSGQAWFAHASFSDTAWFSGASFAGDAQFGGASFSGPAEFGKASFSGRAQFGEATFSSNAWFHGANFSGWARFDRAAFKMAANFGAIEGRSTFSLDSATFLAVPDFIQAHFAEAPRLDHVVIEPRRFWPSNLARVKAHFKGDRDLSARWRALKRLAVQGHDHMNELQFFQNELKTRRWSTDRPWHAVFWFGLFYGWLSDFGRSIVRPILWWAASALAFAPLYLGAHFDRTGKPFSVFGWIIDRFVLQPFGAAVAPPLSCMAGSGDPWWAALGVSARKALLFFGLDSSDKLTLNYACLYDVISQKQKEAPAPSGQLPGSFYLDVPNSVIVYGIAQHIISAVLLFLLLLAIRNHFRIK